MICENCMDSLIFRRRLEQLTHVLYQIPAEESTVSSTNWKIWYGELLSGKYRIVKEIFIFILS